MAAEGAQVILWDVNPQGLDQVRAELEPQGRKVSTYVCNQSDRRAIATTAAKTLQDCRAVDVG